MGSFWKLDQAATKLVAKADEIAREVIQLLAPKTDEEARFPRENIEALNKAGLLGLVSAHAVGGCGQGLRAGVAVAERIARDCPSTAMVVIMHYIATAVIEKHGTEAMRRSIAQHGKLATLAFSEFGSRSHFWVPQCEKSRTDCFVAERKPRGVVITF